MRDILMIFSQLFLTSVIYDNTNMIILKDKSFISALLSFLAKTVKSLALLQDFTSFNGNFATIQVCVQGTQKPTGAWTPNSSCVEKCCGP